MIGVGDYKTTSGIARNVESVLETGVVSYGRQTREAEEKWAALHGVKHAIAVSSGTAALHVAVLALAERDGWVKGMSEVIVPATTFVATYNVIVQAGYIPRLVDVMSQTALINPLAILNVINIRTAAVIPVHLFGQSANMRRIMRITKEMGISVIEDSAEAVLAKHDGQFVGSFGDFGCFSTYVAHHVPAGMGGFITTNDDELNTIARSVVNHGRDTSYYDPTVRDETSLEVLFSFERSGLNYRSGEIISAVINGLLDDVEYAVQRRREIAAMYHELLADLELYGLERSLELPGNYHSWMMFPVLCKWCATRQEKFGFMAYLYKNGVDTRECLPLVNQPYLVRDGINESNYPVAERWNRCGFYLPCHQYMSDDDVEYVALMVRNYILDKFI
jgi:dTDP-4-amino-4,6-dideoxygalactose transaminase